MSVRLKDQLAHTEATALRGRWKWPAIAAAAIAIAIVRAAITIPQFNNVVDEPFHIAGAIGLYDMHRHVYGAEHPPLPRLVAGFPLWLCGVHLPPQYRTHTVQGELRSCEAGAAVLFADSGSYWRVLYMSRTAMLVFPVAALVYLYALGRWLIGPAVAALAVVLFSLDPTLLGHAVWVCTDVAAAAGFLAALYHGSRWIVIGGWWRAVGAGVAVGLAVACKFTCLLVVPALLAAMAIRWIRPALFNCTRGTERPGAQLAFIAALAFVTLWATYLFDVGRMSDQARFRPDSQWRHIPTLVTDTPIPMPSFAIGLLWFAGHSVTGHPEYLNGRLGNSGWWYYFPEALMLKSSLGFLLAISLATASFVVRRHGNWGEVRPGILIAVPLFAFVAMCVSGRINIGIRHLLPATSLITLLACWQLVRVRWHAALAGCITLAAVETGAAHPDYMSFFNVAAGGARGGERYLIDSNLDWGQDVRRLARWLNTGPEAGRPYSLRLFAYPQKPLLEELNLHPTDSPSGPHGLFAISKNIKHRLIDYELRSDGTRAEPRDYSWLAHYPRIATVGTSIDVYDLDRTVGAVAQR